MAKRIAAMLALLAGLVVSSAEAGFRSPESRVRNVYAYYSNGNSELRGDCRVIPRPRKNSSIPLRLFLAQHPN